MITIQVTGIEGLIKKLGAINMNRALNNSIKKSVILLQRNAQIETPVDKGLLRNAYRTSFSDLEGELVNTKAYGVFVHEGTRPHTISIKNKRVLTNGKIFFGKIVNHPGNKANKFLERAIDKSISNIQSIFNSEIAKELNQST